jgi:phosphoribosylanthranilate isomerase
VILAGGLTADNVAAGIERVRPAGVDSHTGVEGPDGRKQRDLVARFVANARAALVAVEA